MKIQNWPLLMLAIEFIAAHPEKYDQGNWRCGSTRCVAGWIAELSGAEWQWPDHGDYVWPRGADREDEDNLISAEMCAFAELGLEEYGEDMDDISSMLFNGSLSWRQVLRNVEKLAIGDGVTLTPKIVEEITRIATLEASY